MVEVMRNVSLCCHTNYTKWTKSFWRTHKVTEKKTRSFSHTDRKGEAAAATPWEHVSAKCLLSQWQDDFTLSSGLMVSTLFLQSQRCPLVHSARFFSTPRGPLFVPCCTHVATCLAYMPVESALYLLQPTSVLYGMCLHIQTLYYQCHVFLTQ